GSALDDGGVGAFGVAIAAHAEQDLAAAELRLREPTAVRVGTYQTVEHVERAFGAAIGLVGARQLIHHRIVALVVRIGAQQSFVQLDGFLHLETAERLVTCGTRAFIDLQLQVAESAHRLCTQARIVRLHLEKTAVLLDRLLRLHVCRRIGCHLDLAILEVLDRSGAPLLLGRLARRGYQQDTAQSEQDRIAKAAQARALASSRVILRGSYDRGHSPPPRASSAPAALEARS